MKNRVRTGNAKVARNENVPRYSYTSVKNEIEMSNEWKEK